MWFLCFLLPTDTYIVVVVVMGSAVKFGAAFSGLEMSRLEKKYQ